MTVSYTRSSLYDVTPPYSKAVLLGNWAERRYYTADINNAILPGVRVPDKCEKHRTVTQADYSDVAFKGDAVKRSHEEERMSAYCNFLKSTTSSVNFMERPDLKENFTTTNTLTYNVLPKKSVERVEKSNLKIRRPRLKEIDLMQGFGNLTKTGISKYKECEKILQNPRFLETTYAADYNWKQKSSADKITTDSKIVAAAHNILSGQKAS